MPETFPGLMNREKFSQTLKNERSRRLFSDYDLLAKWKTGQAGVVVVAVCNLEAERMVLNLSFLPVRSLRHIATVGTLLRNPNVSEMVSPETGTATNGPVAPSSK